MKYIFYTFLWISSSLSIIYLYNHINHPGIVTILNMILQGIFGMIYLKKWPRITRFDIPTIVSFGGYIYFSNISLHCMSIYTYSLLKSIIPMLTNFLLIILGIEKFDFLIIILNLLCVIGIIIAQEGHLLEIKNPLPVIFFIVFACSKIIYCKKSVMNKTPLEMIRDIDIGIGIGLIPFLISERYFDLNIILMSFLAAILGCLTSYSQWTIWKQVDFHTILFLELFKHVSTITLGIFLKETISFYQINGIFIVIICLTIFSLTK